MSTLLLAVVPGLAGLFLAMGRRENLGARAMAPTLLTVAAIAGGWAWLRPEAAWGPAAVIVASAHLVAGGRLARLLAAAVGPVLILGAFGAHARVATVAGASTAGVYVGLALASGLLLGTALRGRIPLSWLEILAVTGALAGGAALITPSLTRAWLRSGIAREGWDVAAPLALPRWPVLVALAAFLTGALWAVHRTRCRKGASR
jgi:hypothetical protein